MTKAVEKARKYCPDDMGTLEGVKHILRVGFIKGYEQAEKDLALTWEDIKTIEQIITTSDWYDFEISGKLWSKEFYEEVLKRFKEAKNEN